VTWGVSSVVLELGGPGIEENVDGIDVSDAGGKMEGRTAMLSTLVDVSTIAKG